MHDPLPSLVLHVPHASLVVPGDLAASFLLSADELAHELLVMTDRYTDELFALPPPLATTVTFPVSRVVIDPERFVDDADEPMAKKGMGVAYVKTSNGQPLRRLDTAERQRLLARFYEPHHAALTAAVQGALDAHGSTLVVDCHSFPARALPFENDQSPERPDICIGTDARHTPDALRDLAVRTFEGLGWSVEVDRPFAGALVPMKFYRKDLRVRAVMIELNRRLYMDEQTGARLPGFEAVRARVSQALRGIAMAPSAEPVAG